MAAAGGQAARDRGRGASAGGMNDKAPNLIRSAAKRAIRQEWDDGPGAGRGRLCSLPAAVLSEEERHLERDQKEDNRGSENGMICMVWTDLCSCKFLALLVNLCS